MVKLNFKLIFKSVLILSFFSVSSVFSKKPEKKPFNYKAIEAKRKGTPIIVHKPEKRLVQSKDLKTLPIWPGFVRFPTKNDLLHSQTGVEWSYWCYDGNSDLADASHIILGDEPVTLQDISIIARMHQRNLDAWIASGKVSADGDDTRTYIARTTETTTTSDPEVTEFSGTPSATTATGSDLAKIFAGHRRALSYLAQREFDFKSKSRVPFCTINYSKAFFGKKVSFGIELPIMIKVHDMDLVSELSTTDNQILSRNAKFEKANENIQDFWPQKYPTGYQGFYKDILRQKNFSIDPQNAKFGLGDIGFILNRKMKAQYWSHGIAGIGLTAPTAPAVDRANVWPADLGNGGFWEARGHLALSWKENRLFNPHVFTDFRFRFSSSVDRRISRLIDYEVANAGANVVQAKELPLGENLVFNKSFTDEPESSVPALASTIQRVHHKKGAEFKVRVGNIFDQAFLRYGYLDVFYELALKFSDSLSFRYEEGLYDTKALVKNTSTNKHTAGISYCYHWRENLSLEAQGTYVFSGKRALRTFGLSVAGLFKF